MNNPKPRPTAKADKTKVEMKKKVVGKPSETDKKANTMLLAAHVAKKEGKKAKVGKSGKVEMYAKGTKSMKVGKYASGAKSMKTGGDDGGAKKKTYKDMSDTELQSTKKRLQRDLGYTSEPEKKQIAKGVTGKGGTIGERSKVDHMYAKTSMGGNPKEYGEIMAKRDSVMAIDSEFRNRKGVDIKGRPLKKMEKGTKMVKMKMKKSC